MTTLNTIIEEEKNEARRQVADTGTVDVDALLTTAMQRAYETGRDAENKRIKREIQQIERQGDGVEEEYYHEIMCIFRTCCENGSFGDGHKCLKEPLDQLKKEITSNSKEG